MSAIESLCNQLIEEANRVKSCTKEIEGLLETPSEGKTADLLDELRLDGVGHIQKLALALTECFFVAEEKSPTVESNEQEVKANDKD